MKQLISLTVLALILFIPYSVDAGNPYKRSGCTYQMVYKQVTKFGGDLECENILKYNKRGIARVVGIELGTYFGSIKIFNDYADAGNGNYYYYKYKCTDSGTAFNRTSLLYWRIYCGGPVN